MPFLVPAVLAALSDMAVLSIASEVHTSLSEEASGRLLYRGVYIQVASAVRLFLLMIPLPYHSYNGTALKCPGFYQLFYVSALAVLFFHMLSLSMMDPKSLNALVPIHTHLNQHETEARSIWAMLLLSVVADLCHVLLFLHVRSTAPADADLVQGRPTVLFYYVKEQGETERDYLLPDQNGPQPMERRFSDASSSSRMQQISNRVFVEVQNRLKRTKDEWTKQLDEYRNNLDTAGSQDFRQKPLTAFRVLLHLFAYEDVLTTGGLDHVYDQDDGATLMNFVPQLLSFLLHGAYDSSLQLEDWILEACQRNVFFAHRCYWYLRAWALESQNNVDGRPARLSRTSSLASFEDLNDSTAFSTDQSQRQGNNLLPEERAVIEDLLHQVMSCGEEPARMLYFGSAMESESWDDRVQDINGTSPSAIMMAAEAGRIPVDPSTGMPSARHWESISASRKYGFLPLDRAISNRNVSKDGRFKTSYFDSTPVFLDAMLVIAETLFRVPREDRENEFKRQLQLLEVQALPNNAIYMPLQGVNHRVWRIVADESIAINTKERVPCIVCLEVVEYPQCQTPQTRDVRRLLERVTPQELSFGDMASHVDEKALINRWRYGFRDPHRRDTAFEKLASSMRERIKSFPLNKMKTSVKASIEKVKKANIQEFLSLNVPNTFDEEDDEEEALPLHSVEPTASRDINRGAWDDQNGNSGVVHHSPTNGTPESARPRRPKRIKDAQWSLTQEVEPSPSADLERGLDHQEEQGDQPTQQEPQSAANDVPSSPDISRGPKRSKMGQWSSPQRVDHQIATAAKENQLPSIDDLMVPPRMSHRSYQREEVQSTNHSNSNGNSINTAGSSKRLFSGCLPKTIQEEDESQNAQGSGKPPGAKPPAVVFKENWKEKEERLRPTSAYGSHPGWRLLPILIKANDDLRQEQLASQLIYRMSVILARERVPVWLCPYEILALTESGGIIEAIPDTISISSLRKNDPNYTSLKGFFHTFFEDPDDLADAKANFCESLAGYSMVCFLLQMKDRHNGNILLDNRGHLIHIDFGFFFLSSPGKNTGFESAPFKLTREFVEVLDGPDSRLFRVFRMLCYRAFIALRRHCLEIILLVEMLKQGNEDLPCFRGRPDDAIQELRDRFRLDLNDRACLEYVNALIEESLENWRTNWYDRYQRYCVGVL